MEASGLTTHLAAQLGLLKGAPPLVIELGVAVTVLLPDVVSVLTIVDLLHLLTPVIRARNGPLRLAPGGQAPRLPALFSDSNPGRTA